MKKLLLLTIIALLSFALLSCNEKTEDPSTVTVAPESDFEYEENADGGITITKYKGKDENVIVPETLGGLPVTEIGGFSFHRVKTVVFPDTVTVLKEHAFDKNQIVERIVLSSNTVNIGTFAFRGCSALKDIILPESLKTIGISAFEDCKSLKSIRIPANTTNLYPAVFKNSGLETIIFDSDLSRIPGEILYGTNIKEIVIPNSVTIIDTEAFGNCKELKSIKFGKNLKELGMWVFAGDVALTELVFPESLVKIYEIQFTGCNNLTSVKFEGNAPLIDPEPIFYSAEDNTPIIRTKDEPITVYYHEGAEGFSETWNGYKTQVW